MNPIPMDRWTSIKLWTWTRFPAWIGWSTVGHEQRSAAKTRQYFKSQHREKIFFQQDFAQISRFFPQSVSSRRAQEAIRTNETQFNKKQSELFHSYRMQGIVSWKLAVSMQPRMQDFKQAIQFWKHLPKSWKWLRWFPDYVAAAANRLHSSRSEKVLFCVWVNGCLFGSILFIFTKFHSGSNQLSSEMVWLIRRMQSPWVQSRRAST